MVLKVLYVGGVAVDDGVFDPRVFVELVPGAVAFQVGLGDEVDAVLVAEFVPARIIRIVAGAHMVAVGLFDEEDVADHLLFGDGVAGRWPVLVAVDAF